MQSPEPPIASLSRVDTCVKCFLHVFSKIGAFPYRIVETPETRDRVLIPSNSTSHCAWVFGVVSGVVHFVKTALSLTWMGGAYIKSGEFTNLAFHSFWMVALCAISSVQIVFIAHNQDVINLVNGTVRLSFKLQKLLEPKMFVRPRVVRTTLMLIFCLNMVLSTIFCGIPAFIFFRQETWHYGSNLYNILKLVDFKFSEYVAVFISTIMDSWFIWTSWGAAILHLYVLLLIIQTFTVSLTTIQSYENQKSRGLLNLHCSVYPKLRLLISLVNESYGFCYYPPIKSALAVMTIQGICMAVGLSHLNSSILTGFGVGAFSCCATALVIITSFTGIVHQQSGVYIRYLRRNMHGKTSMKVLKSVKQQSIKCGSFYAITKFTSLTLLGMITNIAGSLLISLKA